MLTNAMEDYYTDVFAYPSEEQGLLALISKPEGNVRLNRYREGGYFSELPQENNTKANKTKNDQNHFNFYRIKTG